LTASKRDRKKQKVLFIEKKIPPAPFTISRVTPSSDVAGKEGARLSKRADLWSYWRRVCPEAPKNKDFAGKSPTSDYQEKKASFKKLLFVKKKAATTPFQAPTNSKGSFSRFLRRNCRMRGEGSLLR